MKIAFAESILSHLIEAGSELRGEVELMKRKQDEPLKLGPHLRDIPTSEHHDAGDKATTRTEVVTSTNQGSSNFFIMPKLTQNQAEKRM